MARSHKVLRRLSVANADFRNFVRKGGDQFSNNGKSLLLRFCFIIQKVWFSPVHIVRVFLRRQIIAVQDNRQLIQWWVAYVKSRLIPYKFLHLLASACSWGVRMYSCPSLVKYLHVQIDRTSCKTGVISVLSDQIRDFPIRLGATFVCLWRTVDRLKTLLWPISI